MSITTFTFHLCIYPSLETWVCEVFWLVNKATVTVGAALSPFGLTSQSAIGHPWGLVRGGLAGLVLGERAGHQVGGKAWPSGASVSLVGRGLCSTWPLRDPAQWRLPLLNPWPPRSLQQEKENGGVCVRADQSRESEGGGALMWICVHICVCVCVHVCIVCVPVRASLCACGQRAETSWLGEPQCPPQLSPHLALYGSRGKVIWWFRKRPLPWGGPLISSHLLSSPLSG